MISQFRSGATLSPTQVLFVDKALRHVARLLSLAWWRFALVARESGPLYPRFPVSRTRARRRPNTALARCTCLLLGLTVLLRLPDGRLQRRRPTVAREDANRLSQGWSPGPPRGQTRSNLAESVATAFALHTMPARKA